MRQAMLHQVYTYNLDLIIFFVLALACLWYAERRVLGKAERDWPRGVIWGTGLILTIAVAIGARMVGDNQHQQLKTRVAGFAPTYAAELESLGHQNIGLNTSKDDPLYLSLIERQKRWLAVNPAVNDIYTMRKLKGGQVALIVDSETDYDRNGQYDQEREQRTPIGEVYVTNEKALLSALEGTSQFEDVPYTDRWGTWVSAFVPLFRTDGSVDGILGVDFAADKWIKLILMARILTLNLGLALIFVGSICLALLLRRDADKRRMEQEKIRLRTLSLEMANERLTLAHESAKAASLAKSEFLANMSHEIRTPMNGILGLTELLLREDVSTEHRHQLELIRSSANAMTTMLNDVLDFSKIEANKLNLDPQPFDLREMAADAIKIFAVRAKEKNLKLSLRIAASVPRMLVGDAGRIRQILMNLVGNSMKFTEQGRIDVAIDVSGASDNAIKLTCSVSDTGIGIDNSKLTAIFDPFCQADNSTTRKYGGTGLGLSICKRLVTMMDGEITAESSPGAGTKMTFTVLCQQASPETQGRFAGSRPKLDQFRVLIVDSEASNRDSLELLLHSWQAPTESFESTCGVLDALENAEAQGRPYHLVLLSSCLPDNSSIALARSIRQSPSAARTNIVLMNPCAELWHDAIWNEIHLNGMLNTPVRPSELLDTCLKFWSGGAFDDSGALGPTVYAAMVHQWTESRALRILVAEDNYVNQQLMWRLLESCGHTVHVVDDGQAAIDRLKVEKYDVVLMDVNMPNMDGFQATEAIRAANVRSITGDRLPIIALTANAMKGDRERCLAEGMDDYVAKPIDFERLFDSLDRFVPGVARTQVRRVGTMPRLAPAPVAAAPMKQSSAALEQLAVLDRKTLYKRINGDLEFLTELATTFEIDSAQTMTGMRAAFATSDFSTAKRHAHTLKGTAANLAGDRVSTCAAQLEECADRADGKLAEELLGDIEFMLNELIAELKKPAAADGPADKIPVG
jgi:signal transduction histidine kinase/DNA-binding response OmpR family regulator/HPt (histidine-containing phosphotransfer) domain-containing protein